MNNNNSIDLCTTKFMLASLKRCEKRITAIYTVTVIFEAQNAMI